MKIEENVLTNGDKVIHLTLTAQEVRVLALNTWFEEPPVKYWFDSERTNTDYNVVLSVDWSNDGTVQHHGE